LKNHINIIIAIFTIIKQNSRIIYGYENDNSSSLFITIPIIGSQQIDSSCNKEIKVKRIEMEYFFNSSSKYNGNPKNIRTTS
jgi:hypothetical protein